MRSSLRRTLLQSATLAVGLALLIFIGCEVAAFLNHYGECPIRLVTGFEGSPTAKVKRISNTHWLIDLNDKTWKRPHFFLFRIEGATGQSMTFEIPRAPIKWATLNPVYSYAPNLDDLSTFSVVPVASEKRRQAPNGAELPDTSGQGWQFIHDTEWQSQTESKWQLLIQGKWRSLMKGTTEIRQRFLFRQKFTGDAYVCMRYPYTPSYNQRYLDSLVGRPAVQVITVGTSTEGRPLQVVKISEGGESEEKLKPCVLIYAREHADEQDSSWVAQGAIEYLLSDAFKPSELRKRFTFLVIPVLDPDGAAMGVYEHITDSFLPRHETPESLAYCAFFKRWADGGNPLQLVLDLHNVESQEGEHVELIMFKSDQEHANYRRDFFDQFLQLLAVEKGFTTTMIRSGVLIPLRLESWLHEYYGSLDVLLELDAQAPSRHLTIADLHVIGQSLVLASADYLFSQEAAPLMASVDATQRVRSERWRKYGPKLEPCGPLEAESRCKMWAELDADIAQWKALQKGR